MYGTYAIRGFCLFQINSWGVISRARTLAPLAVHAINGLSSELNKSRVELSICTTFKKKALLIKITWVWMWKLTPEQCFDRNCGNKRISEERLGCYLLHIRCMTMANQTRLGWRRANEIAPNCSERMFSPEVFVTSYLAFSWPNPSAPFRSLPNCSVSSA